MGVAEPALIVDANTQVDPTFYMKAANKAIRRECGWHVAPIITETLHLDGGGGTTLLLPSKRIRSIALVKNDDRDVTSQVKYSRRAGGIVSLDTGWSTDLGGIEITLTHGFELEEVADLAALIVALTKRAATSSITVSQSVGGASQRLATSRDGAPISIPLLESEKATLAPYRLTWGA